MVIISFVSIRIELDAKIANKMVLWPTIETPLTSHFFLPFSFCKVVNNLRSDNIHIHYTYILKWNRTNRKTSRQHVQIKIQALHLSHSFAHCTHHLVFYGIFCIFMVLFFCLSLSLSICFLLLSVAYNKRFPSIELFRMGLLLSFRCSLTAFFVRFSFSFSFCYHTLYVCLSFHHATNQKLTDWLIEVRVLSVEWI